MKNKNPLVSIIIRTKNEERWIQQCLSKVFSQSYKNFEVIVVDNESKDKTLKIAKNYKVKIVKIKKFLPGKAINKGINSSKGTIIICLSAHCIPLDNFWLKNLIKDLKKKNIAAVYGRQVPLPYSSPFDKRDLLNTFGLDKKIQKKDSFFHNANSAFKRDLWSRIKFDEKAINIEDRIWAHKIIKLGYQIVYDPSAPVYHYHGIHQNLDEKRCLGVVNILEKLDNNFAYKNFENPSKLMINAIILQKGKLSIYKKKPLIHHTISTLKNSKYINKIILSTDANETIKIVNQKIDMSILRSKELSNHNVDILTICKKTLDIMEKKNIYSDILIITTDNYPNRLKNFYDKLIKKMVKENLDLVLAKFDQYGTLWKNENNNIECLNNTILPKEFRKTKYFTTPFSYGFAVRPVNIRKTNLDFYNAGFLKIKDENR
jgi:rhamnosyltransferase